jgi:hypothetical protein
MVGGSGPLLARRSLSVVDADGLLLWCAGQGVIPRELLAGRSGFPQSSLQPAGRGLVV